ncbi:MAG: ATP-binding cassette domain-containing protein, partial [Alphaproteobacteria bacterium]
SILRERKHEVLVVVSTSYLEEVEDCDRLVYLDGGRAIANGTPGELRARVPLELYRAWGVNPRAIAEAARSLPWVSAARTTGSHARVEVPVDRSPGESRVLADLLALRGRPAAFAERMPVDTESMLLSLARGDVRGGSDAGEGVHATSTTRPAGTAATAPGSLEPAHASSPRPTAAPTAAAPAPVPTRVPGSPVAPRSNGPGDGRPIIRAEHLTRRFGDFTAVDDLTIRVEPGSIFAFLGANGSGKSTTIRMLIGLLSPTGGEIEVDGIDVIRNPRRVRDHIGYMGQKVSLYQGLSLRENVEFYAGLYGLDDAKLRERWGALSERLSLREYEASQPADLPAGVRQRAGLALSTLHQPRVLFLDEPTAGVDVHNRALFWELIGEEARAGVTVFVTTHFLEEADFCDRVCFIQSGRLEADGTPSELRERWSRGYRVRVATAVGAAPGRAAELSAFGEGAAARGPDVRRDGDGLEISAGSLDPAWMERLGDLERACPYLRISFDEPPMTGIFRALSGRSS